MLWVPWGKVPLALLYQPINQHLLNKCLLCAKHCASHQERQKWNSQPSVQSTVSYNALPIKHKWADNMERNHLSSLVEWGGMDLYQDTLKLGVFHRKGIPWLYACQRLLFSSFDSQRQVWNCLRSEPINSAWGGAYVCLQLTLPFNLEDYSLFLS